MIFHVDLLSSCSRRSSIFEIPEREDLLLFRSNYRNGFVLRTAKQQQYFERFIHYYQGEPSVTASSCSHAIGLSKTRWVERYKGYETCYLFFKFIVGTSDFLCNPHFYKVFYKYFENETIENCCWDSESINKAQGLLAVCRKFDHIIAFSVLHHGLQPTKPLATKLQKRNQVIYQAYFMINKILSDLRDIQSNIDTEFKVRFTFAVDMAKSFGIEPSLRRTARCWSRNHVIMFQERIVKHNTDVLLQFH